MGMNYIDNYILYLDKGRSLYEKKIIYSNYKYFNAYRI